MEGLKVVRSSSHLRDDDGTGVTYLIATVTLAGDTMLTGHVAQWRSQRPGVPPSRVFVCPVARQIASLTGTDPAEWLTTLEDSFIRPLVQRLDQMVSGDEPPPLEEHTRADHAAAFATTELAATLTTSGAGADSPAYAAMQAAYVDMRGPARHAQRVAIYQAQCETIAAAHCDLASDCDLSDVQTLALRREMATSAIAFLALHGEGGPKDMGGVVGRQRLPLLRHLDGDAIRINRPRGGAAAWAIRDVAASAVGAGLRVEVGPTECVCSVGGVVLARMSWAESVTVPKDTTPTFAGVRAEILRALRRVCLLGETWAAPSHSPITRRDVGGRAALACVSRAARSDGCDHPLRLVGVPPRCAVLTGNLQ